MVLTVEHGDVQEIRELLGTLVPDVRYEVRGQKILAVASPGGLEQVVELFRELDRPLDQIAFDIRGLGGLEDTDSSVFEAWEEIGSPSGGEIVLERFVRSDGDPKQSHRVARGSLTLIFEERLITKARIRNTIELPDEIGLAILGSSKTSFQIKGELLAEPRLKFSLTMKTARRKWHRTIEWRDGETLLIRGESRDNVILVTPHLMR